MSCEDVESGSWAILFVRHCNTRAEQYLSFATVCHILSQISGHKKPPINVETSGGEGYNPKKKLFNNVLRSVQGNFFDTTQFERLGFNFVLLGLS